MILFIDAGNSMLKWKAYKNRDLYECDQLSINDEFSLQQLDQVWHKFEAVERVILANVRGDKFAGEIQDYARTRWQLDIEVLVVEQETAGLHNGYDKISQLGIDRWLAVVAAWNRYRSPLSVVDCGTAITVDLVDASGVYEGGYICPGLALMRNALTDGTRQIELEPQQKVSLRVGKNTAECVENGSHLAIIGMIEQVLKFRSKIFGDSHRVIVTGGNGKRIHELLSTETEYDAELVFYGMELMSGIRK